ncbi:MAG: fibronectin type III domain-containing protein, partial [Bacteroidota bacterium]
MQIIPQVVPPPPIYFSDYANAGTVNSPLRVQIVLNDLNITNREVRLRTSFEGNGITFQSNDIVSGAGPLFLEGGVPLVLTNVELAPYFQFQNITGISPDVYGQAIPEGLYQFCFEVFDILTGNRLSQRSCVSTVVFQNEPPFLISPYNKSNIEERNPQNIVFQWTPRHINVSNVAYELSIVEIWDNVVDPQAVFLSSPPVFQVTTTATTYVYGPADPLFLSNKSYAWRVQAKAIQGVEEIGLFENQGFSEIFSFSYAKTCDIPQSVSHEVKGSHQANINWDDFTTEVPEFTVRYREKGDASNEWFLSKTTANWVTIWDLKPGTTYEYQVNKKCVVTESEWSLEKEFTTALEIEESDLYECGISPNINVTNQDPLPNISSGEKFKAGDFPVTVREVNGSNGRFTGKGHVSLPYLENIKIAVEFTNILINEEKELAEGTVITVYDPEWKNILDTGDVADVLDDLGDVFTGGDNVDIPLDYEITKDDIKIEDGDIVVTKPDGTTETFDYDEGDTYQITDASGNTFAIDENGNITQEAEGAEGGAATSQNTDGIVSGGNGNVGNPSVGNITANGVLVVFKKGNAKYDFDEADNDFEKTRYPKAKLPNGEDYYPVHKAVIDGKTDEFLAEVTITNPDVVLDSLIFKTVKGAKITTRKIDDKNIAITIKGSNSYRSEEAIITYKDKDGNYKIAASFFIHHIKEQELVNVVMVSVNGAAHIPGLESELNKIYEKAGAKFKIVKEDALQLSVSDWDTKTTNGLLDYDGSGLLSDYPQELKNIHQKYKRDHTNYDPKAYHLFLLPDDIKLTKPLSGFMPKTRQWGYVFNAHKNGEAIENKSSQDLVAAHELGHGVFTLAHPFQNDDSAGSGTNWLMDYGGGNQLPYAHWAAMGDESLQLYLFQDEEDSEIANKIWFTPDWKPFKVENTSTILGFDLGTNFKGAIPGFRNSFGIDYRAEIKNGEFTGKYIDVNGVPATLSYQTVDNGDEVYFYEYNGCGKSKRLKYAYNSSFKDFSDYLSKGKVLSTKVYPCRELCDKGIKFFDDYLYLVKDNNQTEIDALNSIAQLICAEGEEAIDYDILVAQISKDEDQKRNNFWNGHDRYLFDIARELFWERENAFTLYLEALVRVNKNINTYNTRLGSDFTKEDYYASLYYLNDRFLESLKPEDKVSILANIFNKDAFITSGMFGITNDDESLIMKVVNSVNENKSEAKTFLDSLAVTKDLFDDLNSGLDDHLGAKNFTDFILKIARLAKLAYGSVDDSQIAPKYTFTWGIKNVDFVLSWVSTLGDYTFNYEDNQVLLTGQCSSSFVDDGAGGVGTDEECLIDNVPLNPFQDFVQITIIESANLLPELCNNQEAQFCGKGIIVPAIFLEYLNTKKENQQLENLGFNVITIAGIILTGGELAAA